MLGSTIDRREENRNNILLFKTTAPWGKNRYKQIAIPKGSSSIRFHAETAKILEENYNEHIKIYTDGSKKDEKVGCAVIIPDQKLIKGLKPQKTIPTRYSTDR
jgi:hypothetical protein